MNISQRIMENLYDPDNATWRDERWEADRDLYHSLAPVLNCSLREDPAKMAMLCVYVEFLFRKRNAVSIFNPAPAYCQKQARDLPRRASHYLPEIAGFLKVLGLSCTSEAFDRAVVRRIDVFTQVLFSEKDTSYFDLKRHFVCLGNCATPLDLLFFGLFLHRARQNIGNVRRIQRILLGLVLVAIIAAVRSLLG